MGLTREQKDRKFAELCDLFERFYREDFDLSEPPRWVDQQTEDELEAEQNNPRFMLTSVQARAFARRVCEVLEVDLSPSKTEMDDWLFGDPVRSKAIAAYLNGDLAT